MSLIDKIWVALGFRSAPTPQELIDLAAIRRHYDDALNAKSTFHVRERILKKYEEMIQNLYAHGRDIGQERLWHHRIMSEFLAGKKADRGY